MAEQNFSDKQPAVEDEEELENKKSTEYGSVNLAEGLAFSAKGQGCTGRLFPTGFKHELKELLVLSWPMVLTALCFNLMPLTALLFCGQLGKISLDAVSLANSMINVTGMSVGLGLTTACDTLFSQSYGSTNKKQVGVYLQKAIYILLLACFPCWAIHLNIETILLLLGQDEEVARLAGNYVLYYVPALVFNFMMQALCKYMQNQNIVIPPVVMGVIANGINAVLHYVFVFHLDWRTDGSALAQVGANFIWFILVLLYVVCTRLYKETWGGWTLDSFQNWGLFLKLALPGMLMICLEWWCFEVGTILSGTLSPEDLGAQSIMFQMEGLAYMIPIGLSISVSIRVGQYLGAGTADGAKSSARVGFCVVWISAVIVAVCFATLRYYIPRAFSQDEAVINRTAGVLPILSLFTLFDAMAALGGGILRGCGRQTVGAVVIFIGYYVIALPIGIPALILSDLKVAGLWWAYSAGVIIESIAFFILVATTNWDLEADQAQVRAGLKAEEGEDEEQEVTKVTVENDKMENDVFLSNKDNKLTLPQEDTDERSSLLAATANVPSRRRSPRPFTPYRRVSSPSKSGAGGMRRSYSSSQLINTLHGRRFSTPVQPGRKFSVPQKERRFSTKYAPQIQEDVIQKLEEAKKLSPLQLFLRRSFVLLVCAAILVAGVMIRLYVKVPYTAKDMCIPPGQNGTIPANETLPICNNTVPLQHYSL